MRAALFVALALLLGSVRPEGKGEGQTPSASIRGVVREADGNGKAIAGARIELFAGPGSPHIMRTDGAGAFVFSALLPGRYRVRVTRDGFIRQEYGERALDLPGTGFALAADEVRNDVVFQLHRAPTISGRVIDANGEGRAFVLIRALRFAYSPRGARILVPAFTAQTDDHGNYRMYWLDPGAYVLSASISDTIDADSYLSRLASSLPPVYFLNEQEPAAARTIEVSAGEDLNGVDFRLIRVLSGSLAGSFIHLDGVPQSNVTLEMIRRGAIEDRSPRRVEIQQRSLAEGVEWGWAPQPPGSYLIVARTYDQTQIGTLRVDIPERPPSEIKKLIIVMSTGAETAGRVTGDARNTDFRAARVTLTSVEPLIPSPPPAPIQSDGTFQFRGLAEGQYLLGVTGLPDDVYLAAAKSGAVDLLAEGLNIVSPSVERKHDPLALTLRSDGGRVAGRVTDRENRPSPAVVVLAPEPGLRRVTDRFRTVSADAGGAFVLRGVPPGNYVLLAWETVPQYAWLNAEFLARYEAQGIPIQVSPGGNVAENVPLIPTRPSPDR